MAGSSLLEDKSAQQIRRCKPRWWPFLSLAPCLFLGEISNEIENTFHAWNHHGCTSRRAGKREMKTHPAMVLGLIAIFFH